MGYEKKAKLLGDSRVFELDPQLKKYTLRDVGFTESRGGKFILERPLDPESPFSASIKFKMTISADFKAFKMAVTSANGLKEVNLFKENDAKKRAEQLDYLLDVLIKRQILKATV
ncbi:DUF1831 domain-containing protein [Liquorilactobacillus oeni]|uniref:Cysteine desulfurase n=1 Tax=Liquorilactobacillus oeni DSM 19972 TaxID=1423777 RepID=A0A0R1M934_9LACO|nr:DUF1831 domain-containing protein [Liquorilactobacillus oeni]KRL04655.1 hypothetical protein FD46_GL001789 [Liquorilactobacillus oeni DSM 19972]